MSVHINSTESSWSEKQKAFYPQVCDFLEISLYNSKITWKNCGPLIGISIDEIVLSEELNEPQDHISTLYFWGEALDEYLSYIYFFKLSPQMEVSEVLITELITY